MGVSNNLRKSRSVGELDLEEIYYVYSLKPRRTYSVDDISEIRGAMLRYRKKRQIREKMTMAERLERAAPYNIFFNCLYNVIETYHQPNSILLRDLFCPSLGQLKCSLFFGFFVEFGLMEELSNNKPMTIICGMEISDEVIEVFSRIFPNLTVKQAEVTDPAGCHDTKMSIFIYEDESVRICIGSANPRRTDWGYENHIFWLSPKCPKLPDDRKDFQGESPTGFKKSLLKYLEYYKYECLTPFINYIKRANFGEIRVFFIYSVPGIHADTPNSGCHLHQVGNLLSRFCSIAEEDASSWEIICQPAQIGLLNGNRKGNGLFELLSKVLAKRNTSSRTCNEIGVLKIMWPTMCNVLDSDMKVVAVGYDRALYAQQKSFNRNMLQWKVDVYKRQICTPHMRTYFRISPCLKKMAYFLITTVNLTRSGWGVPTNRSSHNANLSRPREGETNLTRQNWRMRNTEPNRSANFSGLDWREPSSSSSSRSLENKENVIYQRSYEVGVLFLPKFFDQEYFQIQSSGHGSVEGFPFIFTRPFVPYEETDVPWH